MKITIASADKIVTLNGTVQARVWEGRIDSGIPVHCFVTRIAVHQGADFSQFERELQEHQAPSADVQAIPLRLII
jgi:hypothetical protein